jgi:hypothetical protein
MIDDQCPSQDGTINLYVKVAGRLAMYEVDDRGELGHVSQVMFNSEE